MGGISPEHSVSLASGCGLLANLDPNRWRGFPVLISRDNEWLWPAADTGAVAVTPKQAEAWLHVPPPDWNRARFPRFARFPEAEIFLLGLHGVGGEDGRLQGFLEMAGQPFTGSGSVGSALAMDKILAKQSYRAHGIPTAPWLVLEAAAFGAAGADRVEREIGLPAVVKHPTGGSSLGVAIARDRRSLEEAVAEIGRASPRILVESFVPGREATCGVLDGFGAFAPTEIRPLQDAYFSFAAKYQKGRTQEITPAEFPDEVLAQAQDLALRSHHALRLSVYSRTDLIWTGKDLFVLETNNLPGFTPQSFLPQQAAHAGLSYPDLLSRILDESLRRWPGS